ncbi:MAG: hypothetical protein B6247_07035 [Candidatus Parabeggiatoa sp. nov. 2]|nr:MAG: hypothetical protein B6247_07035 [Beggiatoa sp. 4572_84]
MRKFSSYGPIDQELHYYVPRQELVNFVYQHLLGDNPDNGGHYISVWAPPQTGKTWIMLQQETQFDVVILPLQHLCSVTDVNRAVQAIAQDLMENLGLENKTINTLADFYMLFKQGSLSKPLILILDDFDALPERVIGGLVSVFRTIYLNRLNQSDKSSAEKDDLLHGLALIGIRATRQKSTANYADKRIDFEVY